MIYSRREFPWKNRSISIHTPYYVMNYSPLETTTNTPFQPSRVYPLKHRRNTLRITMNPNSPYYNTHSRHNTTIKQMEIPNGYSISATADAICSVPPLVENMKNVFNNPNSRVCTTPSASIYANSTNRLRNKRIATPSTNSYTMKYRHLRDRCGKEDPKTVVRYNLNRSSSHRTYTLRQKCLLGSNI
jgi:hypothetical protein